MIQEYTLYKQDAKGRIRLWRISNDDGLILRESGLIDGDKVETEDYIEEGKANRTVEEQIDLFMNSKVKKKIDAGYVYDLEEAKANKPTNALGLTKPMLAKRVDRVKLDQIDFGGAVVQRKYDGHRCMVSWVDGRAFAYSKNGKELTAITEILHSLNCLALGFNGSTLDGELYCHGKSLQRISSLAKKRQPETSELVYVIYDVVSDKGYRDRMDMLKHMYAYYNDFENITGAPSIPCDDFSLGNLYKIRDEQIELGYEGLIVRIDGTGYEDGKRSTNLLKVKKCIDGEFLVKNIIPSKDNWGILVCISDNGSTFTMSAPGTHAEKEECLLNKEAYIGRLVTAEYANLTDDGIPFHPIAKNWRETE